VGITISADLSYNAHIKLIVAIERYSNLKLMRIAFVTYITPILEYNSILLNPNLVYIIDLIESVQRKFTK